MATAGDNYIAKGFRPLFVFIFMLLGIRLAMAQEIKRDHSVRKDYANLFYNPSYTLFDFWSDEPILPDSNGQYTLYTATYENRSPQRFIGFASELSKEISFKFKTKSHCELWIEGIASGNDKKTKPNTDSNFNPIYKKETPFFSDQLPVISADPPPDSKQADYTYLDEIAKSVPESETASMERLVNYLKPYANNEISKTRLIFIWIATHIQYDDDGYNSGHYAATNGESVFKNRTSVCAGYSALFESLALLMGLECVSINGYAKGYSSRNNQSYTQTNHAWNAVKINGAWKLIDVTWGSGYGKTVNGRLQSISELDDFWFLTPSDAFIFSHYPENPEWCLTTLPIRKSDFESFDSDLQYTVKFGFNPQKVLQETLKKPYLKPASIYPPKCKLKVVQAPLEYTLHSSSNVFEIHTKDAIQLYLEHNDQYVPFKKTQSGYLTETTQLKGEIKICITFPDQPKTYWTFLKYHAD